MPIKRTFVFVVISIATFLIFNILMGASRIFPVPIYNIVDFEFSWTATQADLVMQTWGAQVVAQELFITYLDYGYLVGYGSMAFFLLVLGVKLVERNAKFTKFGMLFAFISLASPACDAIENVNLIIMLQGFPSPAAMINAFFGSIFALIKFGVLLAAIGVFAVEIIYAIARKKHQ
nr:hypothetical protein [Candidatus Sigynarchaeota archaeon]